MSGSKQDYISKYTKEDIDSTVGSLNAQIDRLNDSTLPRQPYLLSVPSDVPYRHNPGFFKNWYVGTPFHRREEQLQYMSFLPHQGAYEELLKVVGGWSDDHGNILEEEPSPKTMPNTGASTPVDQASRKKISLKDYQKDKMAPDSVRTSKPAQSQKDLPRKPQVNSNGDGPSDLESRRRKEQLSQLDRGRSPIRTEAKKTALPRIDGPVATSSPKNTPTDSPRSAKRRKLSASPDIVPRLQAEKEVPPKRMPRLLSPTLPSPGHDGALPELLSPLLPPTLLKAITTPPSTSGNDSAHQHQHQRTDSVRSILANTLSEDNHHASEKSGPQSGTLSGSRVRSDSQHSVRSAASTPGPVKTLPVSKAGASTMLKPSTPSLTPSRSPGPRQRHKVVLKYGKKNRKRVEALLKFASRPKKVVKPVERPESGPLRDSKHPPVKESARELAKPATQRDHSTDRPPAKVKAEVKSIASPAEPTKRPTTPLMSGLKDVKGGGTLAGKSVYGTPKKELKSSAMRPVVSTEGLDPATPADKIRSSTPASVERTSKATKTSSPPGSTPSGSEEGRQAWKKLDREREYFNLGRKLKHEGQSLADKATSDRELQKPVLLMVEALLCFMSNLAVQGYVRPRIDPGWNTILGYYNFLVNKARRFPHLHGLVIQMGAVCRQHINKSNMDRLARDPLPDDHTGTAPTPGSDGNTKTHEDAEGYRKKYILFRDELIQNSEDLQQAWLKGSKALPMDVLQKDYPKTWAKRSKDYKDRGIEKPSPGRLATGYYLPIDPATSAFEATQYALTLLGEWAAKEGVSWKPRLEV